MKAVNLYLLTRNRNRNFYTQYENILSARNEVLKVKEHEFENLIHLVELLCQNGVSIRELEGFYYSYTIRQIGKEFDLLKIRKNEAVLNIELKSQDVPLEKIEKQLLKNQHYFGYIAPKSYLFTFVDETESLYIYADEQLRLCAFDELIQVLFQFHEFESGDIDALFCAKDYLISPLNMPQKFVDGRYFLTQQQEMIKAEILSQLAAGTHPLYRGITGAAGTGKTLLLYDLAKNCASDGRCCIIHCGLLCQAHEILNTLLKNVTILAEESIDRADLGRCRFLFVDEAQHMRFETLTALIRCTKAYRIPCIFSYDYFQTLSKTEQRRNIPGRLKQLDTFLEYKLSGRIRSNEEMSSFIRKLLDLEDTSGKFYRYDAVDVVFAQNAQEAKEILRYYSAVKHYTYIEHDTDGAPSEFLACLSNGFRTEDVIGQEFEQVVITLDHHFYYNDEGKLQGRNHPNPDYLYARLFFQAASRTREKLCIVVIGNVTLFEQIVALKCSHLPFSLHPAPGSQ